MQTDTGFRPVSYYETNGEIFEDDKVDDLIMLFGNLIKQPDVQKDFNKNSRIHFWRFMNRLAKGKLNPEQMNKVTGYINNLRKQYPDGYEIFDKNVYIVNHLMLGREAPNIVGKDVYGNKMELKEYRGKITVLYFSGDWCGPCRGEYPFQRFMVEYFKDKPFAIVSVNSDSLERAKEYKKENGLKYRSFWDGGTTKGPISKKWNITGWPAIYILDHKGIIGSIGDRQEKIITVVRDLLYKMKREELKN